MSSRIQEQATFAELIDRGILEIGDGYRAKNSELGGQGPIFLRAGKVRPTHIDFNGVERFQESLAEKVAPKSSREGDVVVTTKGNSTGRVSFVSADMPRFIYSPHLSYWRSLSSDELRPGFLRYWSMSREFRNQLSSMAASTDMAPYLSLIDQKRLRITLPNPEDQQRIAHILGTLDDKIALNRRMNRTLEATARAIFKSWFVDFDPVHAKAEGREPVGMDPETAALFPDSFQDSPLGKIPKGWEVRNLGECAELLDKKRIPLNSRERSERQGPYPYYGAAGVMDHVDDYLFDGVHLLVGEDGSVATTRGAPVLQYVWGRFWANNHAHVLSGLAPISTEFLFLALDREYILPYVTGAVQPKLNQGNLKRVPLVLPNETLLAKFDAAVGNLFAAKRRLADQNGSLELMRDALLPQLLTGKLGPAGEESNE